MDVKERIKAFAEYKGITVKKFEEMCGMSNGYVSAIRKSLGEEKLNNVLSAFEDLSRDWLLYGEGDMLRPSVSQTVNAPMTVFRDNNVGSSIQSPDIQKALDEIAEQRKLVAKSQEQIGELLNQNSRLLTLLERASSKQ